MAIPIYQVDSFTDEPFRGNPAGVCMPGKKMDEDWMLKVAREMNLSETAFLEKTGDGYNLRWFTPKVEVALCGHATLASAHILWSEGYENPSGELRFNTRSGVLGANKKADWIELDFPHRPESPVDAPAGLIEALGIEPKYIGKNEYDYFVEAASESDVRNTSPDFRMLREFDVRGVIVTSRSDSPDYDFVSRFFAPGAGIDEDPVTGSAHCCLTPYWSKKLGKKEMVGYQASERGGIVRVRMTDERVFLQGKAVTIFKGELEVE